MALASIVAAALAAVAGAVVAPLMTPAATAILIGVALLFTAAVALRPADALVSGTLATTLAAAIGDRTAFVTFALAVRGPHPALAGLGAAMAALAVIAAAAGVGHDRWRSLPHRAIGIAVAALLGITGIVSLAGGLRLV